MEKPSKDPVSMLPWAASCKNKLGDSKQDIDIFLFTKKLMERKQDC